MALTLAQIVNPGTAAQAQQQVLDGMAGRSIVTKTGIGTGSLSISGLPSASYAVAVKISTAGEPGAAAFQVSLDGGATYAAALTVPSSGVYALTVGVTLTFAAGPPGAGTSFALGDLFAFSLSVSGLASTAWQDGSVPKTLALTQGQALADQRALIAALARGGFVTSQPGVTGAAGQWLALAGQARYGLTPNPAVATAGTVVLTDVGGIGPVTIIPGQLWFGNTASLGGSSPLRYSNATGGMLPLGGTLSLSVQAESPGAAYNVGNGTITTLLTSLAGVTANNPDPGTGTWITTQGTDAESDLAYSLRCINRWATLGNGSPAAAYDTWTRTASSEVTRTKVTQDGTVAGQINLTVAGSSGPVSGAAVTAVTSSVTPKVAFPATLNVVNATATAIIVTATVNVAQAYLATAQAAAEAALLAYLQSVAVGGTVYLSKIIDALQSPQGVRDVTVTAPTANTVLGASAVPTIAGTRTYTGV